MIEKEAGWFIEAAREKQTLLTTALKLHRNYGLQILGLSGFFGYREIASWTFHIFCVFRNTSAQIAEAAFCIFSESGASTFGSLEHFNKWERNLVVLVVQSKEVSLTALPAL